MALVGEMQYLTIGSNTYSLPTGGGGGGSVTNVAVSNDTNGGLSVSGSPITSSGTITIGHSNVLTSAQTTQAVYPIKIDKNGHISAYGSAVSIPSSASNGTTGISIADHSTDTIYGVSSTTTSVYGVQSSTTIASKITLDDEPIDVSYVSANGSGSFSATVTSHVLSFSHTHTAPTVTQKAATNILSVSDVTVPIKDTSSTTVPIKNTSSTTVVTGKTHTVTDNGHTHSLT